AAGDLLRQPDGRLVMVGGADIGDWINGAAYTVPALARFWSAPVHCVVPHLRGMKLSRAKISTRRAQCRVGTVTKAFSRVIAKAHVISQRPMPGRTRRVGAKIDLVVSKAAASRRPRPARAADAPRAPLAPRPAWPGERDTASRTRTRAPARGRTRPTS